MNPNSFTPKRIMILAVIGFGVVSFLAYHWLTQPILASADVTQFTGFVKEAREFSGKNAYLEIALVDQPHSFRCFSSLYPHAFKVDLHGRLGVGKHVSLGVATSESSSPRRNWSQNQQYFKFITMSIGDTEALSLNAHNKTVESDRRTGPWFCLIMATLCAWLFWLGFSHRNSSEPILAILKAKKRVDHPT